MKRNDPRAIERKRRIFRRRRSAARRQAGGLIAIAAIMLVVAFRVIALPHAAAPASYPTAFRTCAQARGAGMQNIPRGSPYYAPWLDADGDGIACENRAGG